MSTNVVHEHGTENLKVAVAVAAHRAGDLVCEKGFFGVVDDTTEAGAAITLRLNVTARLKYVPSTLAAGVVVAAPVTASPTSLPIAAAGATGFLAAVTAGWIPIGKTIATGTATTAVIQLFNPNPYQITMP